MNGKGDTQRPAAITHAEYSARYAGTFCADSPNVLIMSDARRRALIAAAYPKDTDTDDAGAFERIRSSSIRLAFANYASRSKVVPPANCASDRGVR